MRIYTPCPRCYGYGCDYCPTHRIEEDRAHAREEETQKFLYAFCTRDSSDGPIFLIPRTPEELHAVIRHAIAFGRGEVELPKEETAKASSLETDREQHWVYYIEFEKKEA